MNTLRCVVLFGAWFVGAFIAVLLLRRSWCKLGCHDWRNGPGSRCAECGYEDPIWKEPPHGT